MQGQFLPDGADQRVQFEYFTPDDDLKEAIGSYYQVSISEPFEDRMRAEIANVRFVLEGSVRSDLIGSWEEFKAPAAILCGPTFKASNIEFAPGTVVFGAAVTPLGWAQMAPSSAHHYADRFVDARDAVDDKFLPLIDEIFSTKINNERLQRVNGFFKAARRSTARIDRVFLDEVTQWITQPGTMELEDLLERTGRSQRQLERLCKAYFGGSPKKLHRKFRALHAANAFAWDEHQDWRDVASTTYYDQAHFIREFKTFNGRTPNEFINGPHFLVRVTLDQRRQIDHPSPYSLIG